METLRVAGSDSHVRLVGPAGLELVAQPVQAVQTVLVAKLGCCWHSLYDAWALACFVQAVQVA